MNAVNDARRPPCGAAMLLLLTFPRLQLTRFQLKLVKCALQDVRPRRAVHMDVHSRRFDQQVMTEIGIVSWSESGLSSLVLSAVGKK
jgi:hypothetical protein